MHSGQGEEASGDSYRPLPLPREPREPSSEPREGIVLPSKGGRWVPPSQLRREEPERWEQSAPAVQPAAGQPWDVPRTDEPYPAQQQPVDYGRPPEQPVDFGSPRPDADATRLLDPYGAAPYQQQPPHAQQPPQTAQYGDPYAGGYPPAYQSYDMGPMPQGDAEKTQLMAYGQQPPAGDADHTQLLSPYRHQAMDGPQPPDARQPLPPEQRFDAPVPPFPQGAPEQGPMRAAPPVQAAMPQQAPPPAQAGPPFQGQYTQGPPMQGPPMQAVPLQVPDSQPAPSRQQRRHAYQPQPQPPRPSGAPYAIRPGAPGDRPASGHEQDDAAATRQMPTYEEETRQPDGDYDYLYRRDDQPDPRDQPASRPGGAGPAAAFTPSDRPEQRRDRGHNGYQRRERPGSAGRGKPPTALLVGVGIAVLALVGVGAGALFGGGSKSPAPGRTASAGTGAGPSKAAEGQARRLDALLMTSNSSRTTVINAVASIKVCKNLANSASDLRTAAGERDNLVTRLSNMTLDKLPNSLELVNQLTAAWAASSAADNHYADWAAQVAQPKGCHKGQAKTTPQVQQGNLSSGEATIAKQKAAGLWNAIARQYGLTQRQFTQL